MVTEIQVPVLRLVPRSMLEDLEHFLDKQVKLGEDLHGKGKFVPLKVSTRLDKGSP